MIDRIRRDIQERLEQLLSEADRLRQALTALGGDRGQSSSRSTRSAASTPNTRSRSRARGESASASAAAASGTQSRARTGTTSRSRSGGASTSRSRAAAGGTKNAVLKALADANGQAMTASEVAAATGLGRASVSTTLSKLARAGDVGKADRGYRLAGGAQSTQAAQAAE